MWATLLQTLGILALLLLAIVRHEWQLLAFALILAALIIRRYTTFQSSWVRFVLILNCGLIVETLAWLNNYTNRTSPPRLIHPILRWDLILGVGQYVGLAIAWHLVDRWWGTSPINVILTMTVFSIFTEGLGAILLTFNPIIWAYISVVYLSVVLPAFLLVPPTVPHAPAWKRYFLALALLFVLFFSCLFLFAAPWTAVKPPAPPFATL
jgi:hypothetical protein